MVMYMKAEDRIMEGSWLRESLLEVSIQAVTGPMR